MTEQKAKELLKGLMKKSQTLCDGFVQLAEATERLNDASSDLFETLSDLAEEHPELVAPDVCPKCHQRDVGQHGEYPCEECGLPTEWGVADGLTKEQEDLVRELQARKKTEAEE